MEEDELANESSFMSNSKKKPESPKNSLLKRHLDSMEGYRQNEMEKYQKETYLFLFKL